MVPKTSNIYTFVNFCHLSSPLVNTHPIIFLLPLFLRIFKSCLFLSGFLLSLGKTRRGQTDSQEAIVAPTQMYPPHLHRSVLVTRFPQPVLLKLPTHVPCLHPSQKQSLLLASRWSSFSYQHCLRDLRPGITSLPSIFFLYRFPG